jgi:ABC-type antimicrobial peptide transport system permease subunit
MVCNKCGTDMPERQTFCPKCGAAQAQSNIVEMSSATSQANGSANKPKKKQLLIIGIIAISVALVVVVTVCVYQYVNSFAYKLKQSEIGDIVTFGHYEQDNNQEDGKEKIEWIVLDKKDNKALLISKYALDCQPYHKVREPITWGNCTLRRWLNNAFLHTAFSAKEQSIIPTTMILTSGQSTVFLVGFISPMYRNCLLL